MAGGVSKGELAGEAGWKGRWSRRKLEGEKGYVRVTTGSCPLGAWHTGDAHHLGDEWKNLTLCWLLPPGMEGTLRSRFGHMSTVGLFIGHLVGARLLSQTRCDFPLGTHDLGVGGSTHYRMALHRGFDGE